MTSQTLSRDSLPAPAAAGVQAKHRKWHDRPGLVLLVGAVLTGILAGLDIAYAGSSGTVFRQVYVVIAPVAGSLALLEIARRPDVTTLRYRPLAAGVAMTALAMASINLATLLGTVTAVLIACFCFVAGSAMALSTIVPFLIQRMDRQTRISAGVDTTIMFVAGATVLTTIWSADIGAAGPTGMLIPLLVAALAASGFIASVAALAMRAVPTNLGFWVGLPGVTMLGFCWLLWVVLLLDGQAMNGPVGLTFTFGILLTCHGWMMWDREILRTRPFEMTARWLTDWVPMGSIMLCAAIEAIPHGRFAGIDPAPAGTAAVVLLAIVRQRLLLVYAREARDRLVVEVEERAQTILSLTRLERGDSLHATAFRICDEALRLPGIDSASVYAFQADAVVPIALEGITRDGAVPGDPISPARAKRMRARAQIGPWVDAPGETARPGSNGLVGEAYAPMHWDGRVVGLVAMGTTGLAEAQQLLQRLPTLTEFGVVSAALLGPALADQRQRDETRAQLDGIIAAHAFTPVFQPVLNLRTREIVGFEALTRFRDGTPPDQRFMQADAAGMTVRLETACIGDQVEAASWLPSGAWVSLNVSPALARAVIPIISALERVDRQVVLEITEHVIIDDYRELMAALDLLRGKALLAVDDAGAGYAGLRHILELKPQFVKLDISLVRNVDADRARQAMVAGMAYFASHSNCELIAEGIETAEELTELIRLGVSLGQGYLFGKPGPVADA